MDELSIHGNKRPDRTYISPAIDEKDLITQHVRKIRIVSKVIDSSEEHIFAKVKKELVLRVTSKKRQELVAKFYEDTRGVFTLTFQKFSAKDGTPHKVSFSFIGDEIRKVIEFLQSISELPLEDRASIKLDDSRLKEIIKSKDQLRKLFNENEEILTEFLKNDITKSDIVTLGFRKKQLNTFDKLLNDKDYFKKLKVDYNVVSDELLWQKFFEKNTWIFGYGLNFFFNSPLEDQKLEQVVAGFNFNSSGKRVDALLKTRGLINSLCFAEIKTPDAPLLKLVKEPYRPESWQISSELSGAVAQIHKTVQKSIKSIGTKTDIKDNSGNLTGEQVFLYQPKSFLIIGNLAEFIGDEGINEDKFASFELFRQNLRYPEIITFDELFERVKFILKNVETPGSKQ